MEPDCEGRVEGFHIAAEVTCTSLVHSLAYFRDAWHVAESVNKRNSAMVILEVFRSARDAYVLVTQGVSAAIKRRAGSAPFREVAAHGPIPLSQAVSTGAGRLPYRGIIHVAGIDMWWRASEASIRDGLINAVRIAGAQQFRTLATPILGAGSGGVAKAAR